MLEATPGAQRRKHPVGEAPEAFQREGDTPRARGGGTEWKPQKIFVGDMMGRNV